MTDDNLIPGNWRVGGILRCAQLIADAISGTAVIGKIGKASLLLDIKGASHGY
jgi:hypothetical protein